MVKNNVILLSLVIIILNFGVLLARIQFKAYGSIVTTAYYYADIFVGTPIPQRQSVILDTGSNLLAFTSSFCQQCGNHLDSYYDPNQSRTSQKVHCESFCEICVENKTQCAYNIKYLEGSNLSGRFFEDIVSFKNEGIDINKDEPDLIGINTVFGGITHETHYFTTQAASGIFGLAYTSGKPGRIPLFQAWSKKSQFIQEPILSICFSHEGGVLSFGGYNNEYWDMQGIQKNRFLAKSDSSFLENSYSYFNLNFRNLFYGNYDHNFTEPNISWTPLTISRGNYFVELNRMGVNKQEINFPNDVFGRKKTLRMIIDSGTTLTYFPTSIFNEILKQINNKISESEYKSGWRKLVSIGESVLSKFGIMEKSSQETGLNYISVFPNDFPNAALLRKRIYYRNLLSEESEKDNNTNVANDYLNMTKINKDIRNNTFNNETNIKEFLGISNSSDSNINNKSKVINNNNTNESINKDTNCRYNNTNTTDKMDEAPIRVMLESTKGEKCWKFKEKEEMSKFPSIHFQFLGGVIVKWTPDQYLYKKYRNTYCLGFDSDDSFVVLGSSFFIDKDVIIDIKNSRVAFMQSNCPHIIHARRTPVSEVSKLLYETANKDYNLLIKSEIAIYDSHGKSIKIGNSQDPIKK